MFIRKKRVKGMEYYYLVKSIRDGNVVRQKVVKYLGSDLPDRKTIEKIKNKHRTKSRD